MMGSQVGKNTIVMSISMEELRELIFETVRSAVAEKKTDKDGGGGEEGSAVVSKEDDGGLM